MYYEWLKCIPGFRHGALAHKRSTSEGLRELDHMNLAVRYGKITTGLIAEADDIVPRSSHHTRLDSEAQ
ncbi:hypothetical protein E2C01_049669 [Portunus trituberculatus]|uniref:Uncharacterized protein n=1 Tax=Portunus trituberculatus TaxID=210409 RepID=A0A5B7GEA3_PORTR|nr:hypothetical protein [Portunus trituberculatus]